MVGIECRLCRDTLLRHSGSDVGRRARSRPIPEVRQLAEPTSIHWHQRAILLTA